VRLTLLLLFFLSSTCPIALGQNLVPNPSFEEFSYCPVTYNQTSLTLVEGWRQATSGTPDYFNSCSSKAGVPDNVFGNQDSKSGNGYAGMVTFASSKRNYREYLVAPLSRKMNEGEMFCIELFVSPADDSRYITDGIGVTLSKKQLKYTADKVLETEPAMECPPLYLVDGYDQWTLLSQEYTATGGERFLTIGNFRPDERLNVLKRTIEGEIAANNWAYVYVDSVVVKPINSKAECSCTNELLADVVVDPPAQLDEGVVIDLESVLFDFDKDELTEISESKLSDVATELLRRKHLSIKINGHTDIVGRVGYNEELSKRRALAVQHYLSDRGIDLTRLVIDYYGSEKPAAENNTQEGRAQNRRVEFEIIEKSYQLHGRSSDLK